MQALDFIQDATGGVPEGSWIICGAIHRGMRQQQKEACQGFSWEGAKALEVLEHRA